MSSDSSIHVTNETSSVALETENQTCSGNILTKLQCIRMPEPDVQLPDSEPEPTSNSDRDQGSEENLASTHATSPTPNDISEGERGGKSCSGSILTTLQCIKMPIQDSDANSISSLESAYFQSQIALHDMDRNAEGISGDRSNNSSRTYDADVSINVSGSEFVKKGESPTDSGTSSTSDSDKEGDLKQDREVYPKSSDNDISETPNPPNIGNAAIRENAIQEDHLALYYVRRLLENDENVDRNHLVDILGRLADIDDDFDVTEFDSSSEIPTNLPQLYPMGRLVYADCDVCLEKKDINLRTCCEKPVCDDCMLSFITIQVEQAIVKIQCPTSSCDKFVHRDEIMTRLSGDLKDKFYRFLVDANKDPYIKTCPRCSTVMNIEPSILKDPKVKKRGLCVNCNECQLEWCFTCQAPWHANIKCKQFREGDKLFKRWTKEQPFGQPNARKCPKCKIFIQRSTGCDHMRCAKCNTDFCYQCGEKFLQLKFIGDHYSRFSVFGCKYRLYPDNPVRRKLIRGSIFGGKLLLTPIIAGLVIGAGAVILAGGIFILPVWAGFRIRRHLREKEARKRERLYREHWQKRREEIKKIGDPYLENFNHWNRLGMNPYNLGGSFGKGQGRVLMVDELDMRLPHVQVDSLSLTSLDNNSSADSFADGGAPSGGQRIKLSPNSLDIHASLDAETKPAAIRLEPVQEIILDSSGAVKYKAGEVEPSGDVEMGRKEEMSGHAAGSTENANNGARPKVPKVKTTKRREKLVPKKGSLRSNNDYERQGSTNRTYEGENDKTAEPVVVNISEIIPPAEDKSIEVREKTSVKLRKSKHLKSDSVKNKSTDSEQKGGGSEPSVDDFIVGESSSVEMTHSPVMVHRSNSNYEFWI